ncbi:hypothetical protein [Bacillus sp. REN3]|uniref:hypothetical protein n=1 Tax=Bacillus sp. REN3 TaxID=2802440 RepID=UPI001AEE44D9|nr:hypothetical protein [Bacillus sp. REN3]
MSLLTIVARGNYISVVTECLESNPQINEESVKFLELIPDTAIIVLNGDKDYVGMGADAAATLVQQGFNLKEIADSLQTSFHNVLNYHVSGREIEGIIAGFSTNGTSQYHIISNINGLESYYPGRSECFYYANDPKQMLELEKLLKMHGIATAEQAQAAQLHLLTNLHVSQRHCASIYQKAN